MQLKAWLLIGCVLASAACQEEDGGPSGPGSPVDAPSAQVDAAIDAKPPIDAALGTTCAMKDPVVQLIYTCDFVWSQCTGTSSLDHEVDCKIQTAGSLRFSLCDCKLGGSAQQQFTSTMICGSTTWADIEMIANQQCGWDLL